MAKKEVTVGGDSALKIAELKRELKKTVTAISDEEKLELALDAIDRAREVLFALRDLKASKTASLGLDDVSLSCPEEFKCPLSKHLIRDPVLVSTGQTYDRAFIQKWLKAGNRTCPRTQQVLSHTLLTPNHLIKEMISKWCRNRGITFPDQKPESINGEDMLILKSDRDQFTSLLEKISSSSVSDQKSSAKELRHLTKRNPTFRALSGESTASIIKLINPLSNRNLIKTHPDLQEDIITTVLNISIHDSNKKIVAEIPTVLENLTDALRCGTMESKSNAAAALFTLSALDSNKLLIAQAGALKPLIELLNNAVNHPLAIKDAASAIFNLCILHQNKGRAVVDGAVRVLLDKIKNGVHVDELLAILAMLSSHQRAIEEMGELGSVRCLLKIIRESSCARNKENCIAILYSVCMSDRTRLREMREEERDYGTLSKLAKEGTSRAKRKANGILERMNRGLNLTHTA